MLLFCVQPRIFGDFEHRGRRGGGTRDCRFVVQMQCSANALLSILSLFPLIHNLPVALTEETLLHSPLPRPARQPARLLRQIFRSFPLLLLLLLLLLLFRLRLCSSPLGRRFAKVDPSVRPSVCPAPSLSLFPSPFLLLLHSRLSQFVLEESTMPRSLSVCAAKNNIVWNRKWLNRLGSLLSCRPGPYSLEWR